jgi:phosphohistidine swiveling domain-containing protein
MSLQNPLPKKLDWQLMYEGPDLGHFLGQQVFIDPFMSQDSLLNSFTGFEYDYYLWYSDKEETDGIHGGYYVQSDLDRATEHGKKIFFDEEWLNRWYSAIDKDSAKAESIVKARQFEDRLESQTTKEILQVLPEIIDLELNLVTYVRCSQPQHTDALKHRLYEVLREKIADGIELEQAFVDLTLPEEKSMFTDEELAWLDIVIEAEGKVQKKDIACLTPELLSEKYGGLWQRLKEHTQRFKLLPASDRTPAWDIDHFVELLKTSLVSDIDYHERKAHVSDQYNDALEIKKALVEKYVLSDEALVLGQRIAKIGFYRFKASFFWRWMGYYMVLVSERYAKEFGLSYKEMSSMTRQEFLSALGGKMAVEKDELSRRAEAELYLRADGKNYLWWGEDARQKKQEILGAVDYESMTELKGEIGNTGLVRGIAYVFHWSDDVAKKVHEMPKGSILVAPQTHPTYMPAIRLAAALACDEGGVTGHAAIVSRELHKPCVIGLHIGTKVIKTGDEIEVDANNGIVRIIKKTANRIH